MNRNVATLLCALMLLIVGCGKTVDTSEIVYRAGIYYKVNSEVPFTGRAVGYYENGQKKSDETYKNGKQVGKRTIWHENSQKRLECTYIDGEKEGKETIWYENGQKKLEQTFKDGKFVTGTRKQWDENGDVKN